MLTNFQFSNVPSIFHLLIKTDNNIGSITVHHQNVKLFDALLSKKGLYLERFCSLFKLAIHRGRISATFRIREGLLTIYDVNICSSVIHMDGANKTTEGS
jgi:hypothetical protein